MLLYSTACSDDEHFVNNVTHHAFVCFNTRMTTDVLLVLLVFCYFSDICLPNAVGGHGYQVSFPRPKAARASLTSHPHLAPRLKKEYSYTSTPFLGFHGLS